MVPKISMYAFFFLEKFQYQLFFFLVDFLALMQSVLLIPFTFRTTWMQTSFEQEIWK
jgi:hypothetical protein